MLEIKENLQDDIVNNKQQIIMESKNIKLIDGLIWHLESKLPYSDTLNFTRIDYFELFNVNRAAFESLKNIGFEKLSSNELKRKLTNYYDIYSAGRSTIVERMMEEQHNALQHYLWEKRMTYVGDSDYHKFIFKLASEDRFYINFLHTRKNWKKEFINDILYPNINQADSTISTIDEELQDQ